MTLAYCGQMCQQAPDSENIAFMGVEVTKCYCLQSIANAQLLNTKSCSTKCPGDSAQLCGGKGSLMIHQLKNDSFTNVMAIAAGNIGTNGQMKEVQIVTADGTECEDHGIPDFDAICKNAGFTVIGDSRLLVCGGKCSGNSSMLNCFIDRIHQFFIMFHFSYKRLS